MDVSNIGIHFSAREKGKCAINLNISDNIICEPQTAEIIQVILQY